MPSQATNSPERTCIGCGAKRSKRMLIRLALEDGGRVRMDKPQTAPGRGAYLCQAGCLRAAVKRKAFQRAFRFKGSDLNLVVEALEVALKDFEPREN
ncbi:MAG: YlxR family protein [Myxococcaceae bacterium]